MERKPTEASSPPTAGPSPTCPATNSATRSPTASSFWGHEEGGELAGVMGLQDVQDVTLIRHAYVRTANRNQGIGGMLLTHLRTITDRPVLIGTWADAVWAIGFYEKHGFRVVDADEKNVLLKKYWNIPERQVETSVVLTDRPQCRRLRLPLPTDSVPTDLRLPRSRRSRD